MKFRILFTIDDDPIFDQRIFTLLRLAKPAESNSSLRWPHAISDDEILERLLALSLMTATISSS